MRLQTGPHEGERRVAKYYYTPLPLNLANKQASNNDTLLSVLAITPSHRSGLHSTLAILEPRWWPCQIQVYNQKLTGGALKRGAPRREVPSQNCAFCAPKQALLAQISPETHSKFTSERKRMLYYTCALIAL